MQPGGQDPYQQDPYQQYPSGYGQVPPYSDPFAPQSGPPYEPQSAPPEYSLYQPQPVPQYPPAGYSVPPPPSAQQNNTLGLLSMIFGIVAIPMVCCVYSGVLIGIAAVVLGVLGMGKANRGEASNKGMALAGIICGAVAAVFGIVLIIAATAFSVHTPTYG